LAGCAVEEAMQYNALGRTGISISAISFGAGPISQLLVGSDTDAIMGESVTLLWHRLEGGIFHLVQPDADGVIRSHALPNLWLPLADAQDRDGWRILGTIERGVSRRADFS
jgi:hypothetical protein